MLLGLPLTSVHTEYCLYPIAKVVAAMLELSHSGSELLFLDILSAINLHLMVPTGIRV